LCFRSDCEFPGASAPFWGWNLENNATLWHKKPREAQLKEGCDYPQGLSRPFFVAENEKEGH
jgi:hypothetical protein